MKAVAEGVLLWAGVGAELACCLGVAMMRDPFTRLHYLSATGTLGATAIVAAVLVDQGLASTSAKAVLVLVALVATGPILVHAIARVARVERYGHTGALPRERVAERGTAQR